VKTEQTEGRQPMTWFTVKWAVRKTAVQRIQERIFRAAKMTKRWRLEPYAGGLARPVLRGLRLASALSSVAWDGDRGKA
jgi:hypothetical protein